MPIPAIVITLAMLFYTTATWWEKLVRRLGLEHLALFWIGLIFDTVGTTLMIMNSTIAGLSLHSLTGYIGIILMLVHTSWATVVMIRKDEKALMDFHKFSVAVWTLWMFSFVNGAVLGMRH